MQQQPTRQSVTQFRGLYAMSATASAAGSKSKSAQNRPVGGVERPKKRAG